jgi:flagellar basal body-associated protein FliL
VSTLKSEKKLSDRYSSQSPGSADKGSSGKGLAGKVVSKPVLIAIVVVIVIVVAVVVVAMTGSGGKDSNDASYNVVTMPDDAGGLSDSTDSEEIPSSYDVSMNSTWTFDNAESASSNAYVANIETNTNTVYFVVTRNDTGDTIYTSPDIPVGGNLSGIKLDDTSLTQGEYPCVVTYYLLGADRSELSHVNMSVTVVIEH